jgi:putative endonuclease
MICRRDALKRHSRYWVYVVQSADGTYYTGSTNNLENRLKLHNAGHGAKYLRGKGPLELVYAKEYRYDKRVVQAELAMKKLTRKQKEELIKVHARSCESLHSQ